MEEQRPLFARPKGTIDERFRAWLKENPHVLELYLKYSRELLAAGRKRYSVKAITERVRWHVNIQTTGDQFKINDHFSAPMARILVQMEPKLESVFSFRKRTAKQ